MSLIAVDAGHGGYDGGAAYKGRVEKNDNLRLAQAVQRELESMGQQVIMTRDSDVFIPLPERSKIANNAGAVFFISLHRNSYTHQTPGTSGVENWVYTYASPENERMARIVLGHVAGQGVQAERGVKRGNYAVLRNADQPAMLLEMGYIINEEDNRLFDAKLNKYARAIAAGIVEALGGADTGQGQDGASPAKPPSGGISWNTAMKSIQQMLNDWYGANLKADGIYGPATKRAIVRAIQTVLNREYGAHLAADGIFGSATRAAIPILRRGSRGALVYLLQSALFANGYNPGSVDGIYGANTENAVRRFQKRVGLPVDGIAGPNTFRAMFI